MAGKRRNVVLISMCAVLMLIFLLFALMVPIGLSVKVLPEKVYAGEELTSKDFEVCTKTLFGIRHKVDSYSVLPSDGNVSVLIGYKSFQKNVHIDAIQAKSLAASYDGSVYVGQAADSDKAAMKAEYEDGTSGDVYKVWVGSSAVGNVKDNYALKVYCPLGDANVDVPVVAPKSMSASYVGDAVIGQEFTFAKVDVKLHYPDDTSYRTQEFVVSDSKTDMDGNVIEYEKVKNNLGLLSYPLYLNDAVDLFAITPYGTTEFRVEPKEQDLLTVKYDGVVYEGDTLDDTKLSVTMKTEDDKDVAIKDYKFTNPGPIAMDMDIRVPTKYGTAVLKVKPIPVKSVQVDVGDDVVEGMDADVRAITLVYEDDHSVQLTKDDVEFLNMPEKWVADNTIWFVYHNVEYSFDVSTVLKGVAETRNDKVQMQKYTASDEDIQTLTLICQRIGNKSLSVNANEIALMANRYELYGGGTADAGKLLDYVKSCGYWGTKDSIDSIIEDSSVNHDIEQVVRDALVNGYRSLPQYVDERVLSSDIEDVKNPVQNQQLMTKRGVELLFYKSESDDAGMLYCYTKSAYESVVGSSPQVVNPNSNDSDELDDGGIVID